MFQQQDEKDSLHKIVYYANDLPDDFVAIGDVAIDTEAMGLCIGRDRLCLVQLYFRQGDDSVHLVHFKDKHYNAPNLVRILTNNNLLKIFHFARFDLAILQYSLNICIENIYCTKVASRIARTYTRSHGLKDLCSDLLGVKLSKLQQTSDWGTYDLTHQQKEYAAYDVIFLPQLKIILDDILKREKRLDIAQGCFDFLPIRARMDFMGGWQESILAYKCEEGK